MHPQLSITKYVDQLMCMADHEVFKSLLFSILNG